MTNAFRSPDPLLSANIYASGWLDAIIAEVIAPFGRNLHTISDQSYLWVVRYSRGGQHLKVRVHAPSEQREAIKERLNNQAEDYFAAARQLHASERISRPKLPPIDVEDQAAEEFPDRSLVWTTYQRSHVTLGPPVWLRDDSYVALACACLGSGCALLLDAVEAGEWQPMARRQQLLAEALLAALPRGGFDNFQHSAQYFKYHRDWLLRFFVAETAKEQEMISQFRRQARSATVEQLRDIARQQWADPQNTAWPRALAALSTYTAGFRGQSAFDVDPFTSDVTFPPMFKIFHGLANQIGIPPLQEALVHHLLLTATETPEFEFEANPVSTGQGK